MHRVINRDALKKYLHTTQKFEGTFKEINNETDKVLVVDICLHGKNKLLADHVWVQLPKDRLHYPKGCKLEFVGKVYTYKDSFGIAKCGITAIYALREVIAKAQKASKKNSHDSKYANQRRNRKRK